MVRLVSVDLAQVYVKPTFHAHRAEELLDKLHFEVAHHQVLLAAREHHERTPAKVERRLAERLVHGHRRETVARDAAPVAERLVQRLTQHQADIFDRVVVVHVEVASGLYGQVDERMLLQQLQHMVEESDSGIHRSLSGTV